VAGVLTEAHRVGLGYAIRTAPSRTAALEAAATAVQERLIGGDTASDRMSVAELLAAIEQLSESERAAVLDAARLGNGEKLIARLSAKSGSSFVRALRRLASGPAAPQKSAGDGAARMRSEDPYERWGAP
jgi:hypothetical protein